MTLEEAIKLVSPGEPYLNNMIKALSMMPFLNTDEEDRRLEAAKLVRRNRKRIKYDGPKNGYIVIKKIA
jgi:hypothetical protein